MDSRDLRTLKELIESCLLPELVQDVEDLPIHADNFEEFKKSLNYNLPLVLDHLSNQELIYHLNQDDDDDILQLRCQLIMLLCEQAPIGQPFRVNSNSDKLWTGLRSKAAPLITPGSLAKCLQLYKDKLMEGRWKRNLGSTYGFVHFAELHLKNIDPDLPTTLFVLAIASQFMECIHAEIKQLALSLYKLILLQCPKKLILDANVNKVIISICLENAQKLLKDDCLINLWDNVKEAIIMDERITKDLNWNELDDALQLLFQRIKLEGDRRSRERLRNILLEIIIKCRPHSADYKDTMSRQNSKNYTENVKLFRWIVDLKELYIFECLSISNVTESTECSLQVV